MCSYVSVYRYVYVYTYVSTSASLTMLNPLMCGSQQTLENSYREGNTRPPDLPPEKSVCRSRSNSYNQTWNNRLVPNRERSTSRLYIVTLLIYLLCRVYHVKCQVDESQAGIKTAWKDINNLRYTDDTTLMAESKEELKSLWMKMKEESEKVGLKLNIQKTKIMASGPITSWQTDRETVRDFILGGLQKSLQMVTAAMKLKDACSLKERL